MRRGHLPGVGSARRLGLRRHLDGDRALLVGPVDAGAGRRERIQRRRVGVAVVVVRPDGDQTDGRADVSEEVGVGGGRAVVRDREETGAQRVGPTGRHPDRCQVEQVAVRGGLAVAGQQRAPPRPARAHHQRRLVEFAARVPVGTAGWRTEHLEVEVADAGPGGCGDLPHGGAGRCGRRVEAVDGGDRRRRGRSPDRRDVRPLEDGDGTADVVEVAVGDHHEVEPHVAVPCEPTGGGGTLPGVDQHPRAGCAQQERIPLPDVDRGDREGRGRCQPADDRRHRCRHAGDRSDGGGQTCAAGTRAGEQPGGHGHERDDGDRCRRRCRTTPARRRVRDGQDAARGHGRHREQHRSGRG